MGQVHISDAHAKRAQTAFVLGGTVSMTLGEFGYTSVHNKPNYCVIRGGENKVVMRGGIARKAPLNAGSASLPDG